MVQPARQSDGNRLGSRLLSRAHSVSGWFARRSRIERPPTTWIHEFAREASTRMVFDGSSVKPVWSPDGTQLIIAATRGGIFDLVRNAANGAGKEEVLLKSDAFKFPWDISRDGRWLLYGNEDRKTKEDLWLLPLGGDHRPEPFLVTDYRETDGVFSPEARFIAKALGTSASPFRSRPL